MRIDPLPQAPWTARVTLAGSKNAGMPILAAAALAPGTTLVGNVPHISDMEALTAGLRSVGSLWRGTAQRSG